MLGQQLLNGVVLGTIYALFSLGFTIIFGVLHVINLMYGVFFAVGAYIALYATQHLGLGILGAAMLAAIATGALAVVCDTLVVSPLRRREERHLASLLATMGMSLFSYALLTRLMGTETRTFATPVGDASLSLGAVSVTQLQLMIVALVLLMVGTLFWFLRRTRWGTAIRAIADNEVAAQLMGLSPRSLFAIVSFLGGALAAVAGTLIGMNFGAVQPFMGETMMLQGFAVVIVGGLGSMPGALLAGLLIGILEILVTAYVSSAYRNAVTFSLLLAALWLLPNGLLPAPTAQKV
ncbi:branched-chain amino acid ABC transporter permease [Pandoraea anhela]|uniref:ABC transporter permease n=1 Tax=Pandoraea anhela TaxID=2508295 RepID=A0A5E4WH56_9BURK|nr:branched-chain amino acid ABC transporter permease [Pandoraea anhela]VVE23159.1 ABC transporter permease [Pandoraea anhela]